MRKIRNLFLYGGLTRNEYLTVQKKIWDSNRLNLLIYTVLTFAAMFILFLLSFLRPSLEGSRTSYLLCMFASACIGSVAQWPSRKHPVLVTACVQLFICILLAFGIILGTVVDPTTASASYGILLFAVPMLFIDRPLVTVTEQITSMVVYLIAASYTQTEAMFSFNLLIVLPYGIVSLILCVVTMRMKITRVMLDYENKVLSERDQLTGLLNRRCYDQKLTLLRDKHGTHALFCAFDINGLKNTNDTLGHAAGDELIRAASESIQKVFGQYGTCYRIGGDEFFAIIEDASPDSAQLIDELDNECRNYKGILISEVSVASGVAVCRTPDDVPRAVQQADQEMYIRKRLYHKD